MPVNKDPSIPPPMIGKIGPYTVFVTPPSTPTPTQSPVFESPKKVVAPAPAPAAAVAATAPVQPPPLQFDKSFVAPLSDGSVLGFLKNAAFKLQTGKGRCKSERNIKQNTKCVAYVLNLHQSEDAWCLSLMYYIYILNLWNGQKTFGFLKGTLLTYGDQIRLYVLLYPLLQQLTELVCVLG
ncbi:hypothetical protein PTKIN_Ptkin11bG0125900 [Pterospermum kingtungense]